MKELVIQKLGRAGDVIGILPLLKHLSETGPRPTLCVSEPYAGAASYCSYFDLEIRGEAFEDCIKVNADLKRRYRRVLDASVYGWGFHFHRKAPSFMQEAYHRCGREYGQMYARGDFQHVVYDKYPDAKWAILAAMLIKPEVRNVALSLNGNSSPIPDVENHRKLITDELTKDGINVIDVSCLRLGCVVDLLAIFRECDLVITSDTSTAWLMHAQGPTPYILMRNDLFGPGDQWYAAKPAHNCIASYWYSELPHHINSLIAKAIHHLSK